MRCFMYVFEMTHNFHKGVYKYDFSGRDRAIPRRCMLTFREKVRSTRMSSVFYLFTFHRNVRRIVKFLNEIIESTDAII